MTSYGFLRRSNAPYGVRYGSLYREERPYVQPSMYACTVYGAVRLLYGWALPYRYKSYSGNPLARLIVCCCSLVGSRSAPLPSRAPNNRTGATRAYRIEAARLCAAIRPIATAFATARGPRASIGRQSQAKSDGPSPGCQTTQARGLCPGSIAHPFAAPNSGCWTTAKTAVAAAISRNRGRSVVDLFSALAAVRVRRAGDAHGRAL